MLSDLAVRIRAVLRRGAVERELDDELRFHLQEHADALVGRGVPRAEAERQARVALGGIERVKADCRRARGVAFFEDAVQDLRYAGRVLRRNPSFTLTVMVTLALALGPNIALFSALDALFLRPDPIRDPDQVVVVASGRGKDVFPLSLPNFLDYRARNDVFSGFVAWGEAEFEMQIGSEKEVVRAARVTADYFATLGIEPVAGRTFTAEAGRIGGPHEVLVSEAVSRRRFGDDARALGASLRLNDADFRVVGVVPDYVAVEHFRAPNMEVWVPVRDDLRLGAPEWEFGMRDWNSWIAEGRLKAGVSRRQAQAAMDVLTTQLRNESPDVNAGLSVSVLSRFDWNLMMGHTTLYGLLLALVASVLLIACANVANLLLARGAARVREIGMRLALGATRARLIRQLLTESVLLSGLGSAVGWLIAQWMLAGFTAMRLGGQSVLPPGTRLDVRALAFTVVLSCAVGAVFGLLPALQATRADLAAVLKGGGWVAGSRSRGLTLKSGLVVVQIALSLVVLACTGLFARTLQRAWEVDLGRGTDHLVWVPVDIRQTLSGEWMKATHEPKKLEEEEDRGRAVYRRILDHLAAIPGVQDVAVGPPPLSPGGWTNVTVDGVKEDTQTRSAIAGAHFLKTAGIPLVAGRDFVEQDTAGEIRPAMVSETMARRFWPGKDAVGKRFQPWPGAKDVVFDVVGVARDVRPSPRAEPSSYFYQMLKGWDISATFILRTSVDPGSLRDDVRKQIQAAEPRAAVGAVRTFEDAMGRELAGTRFIVVGLLILAALALVIAAVGLYGLMSYRVSLSTRDLGIRAALGADPQRLVRMVLMEAAALVLAGILAGLAVSVPSARVLRSMIVGSVTDPLTFTAAPLLLGVIGIVASLGPAWRAARIDPRIALNQD